MKWMIGGIVLAVVLTASAGCGESKLPEETGTVQETQTYSSQEEPSRTAEPAQTEEESPVPETDFESLAALLGMEDAETADLLGGGKENWTEDRSFYIGRIYAVTLFGQEYPVYTSCDENGVVNSVSIWLEDGERTVPEGRPRNSSSDRGPRRDDRRGPRRDSRPHSEPRQDESSDAGFDAPDYNSPDIF